MVNACGSVAIREWGPSDRQPRSGFPGSDIHSYGQQSPTDILHATPRYLICDYHRQACPRTPHAAFGETSCIMTASRVTIDASFSKTMGVMSFEGLIVFETTLDHNHQVRSLTYFSTSSFGPHRVFPDPTNLEALIVEALVVRVISSSPEIPPNVSRVFLKREVRTLVLWVPRNLTCKKLFCRLSSETMYMANHHYSLAMTLKSLPKQY